MVQTESSRTVPPRRARVEEAAVRAGLLPAQAMPGGGDPGPLLAFLGYMAAPSKHRHSRTCALLLVRAFARRRRAHVVHVLMDAQGLGLGSVAAARPFLEVRRPVMQYCTVLYCPPALLTL